MVLSTFKRRFREAQAQWQLACFDGIWEDAHAIEDYIRDLALECIAKGKADGVAVARMARSLGGERDF